MYIRKSYYIRFFKKGWSKYCESRRTGKNWVDAFTSKEKLSKMRLFGGTAHVPGIGMYAKHPIQQALRKKSLYPLYCSGAHTS